MSATGYYENGVALEPVTKYAIQRTYPGNFLNFSLLNASISFSEAYLYHPKLLTKKFKEGDRVNLTAKMNFEKFPTSAYVGPPYFDSPVEGEIYMGNYPRSIVTQPRVVLNKVS